MIAQIKVCLVSAPETFGELVMKFIQCLPQGYCRYDIVADTYCETSIKSTDRRKLGNSTDVLVGSFKSKVRRDCASLCSMTKTKHH